VLTSVQERQAALEARHPRWVPRTLHGALDDAAAEFGDRPYVVTDSLTWSYREVQERSVRLANGLPPGCGRVTTWRSCWPTCPSS